MISAYRIQNVSDTACIEELIIENTKLRASIKKAVAPTEDSSEQGDIIDFNSTDPYIHAMPEALPDFHEQSRYSESFAELVVQKNLPKKTTSDIENLVSELYQSTFLIVNLDWTITTDHPPHCLSLNQIETLVERFDLGDLDQPLETPDAFEEAIAALPDLINLERDKLLVFMALRIMRRFHLSFAYPGNDLGCYNGAEYKIAVKYPFPSQPPPRKFNPIHREFFENLETKWTSPVVLFEPCTDPTAYLHEIVVLLKKGKFREAIDYSATNPFLDEDPYPFTTMLDVLHYQLSQKFVGCSVTDMNSIYNQILIASPSRKYMGVRHPLTGQAYQPVRLPFGPTPAPRFAQRALDETLGPLKFTALAPYMDDVSATQSTFFLHFDALGHWFGALVSRGWTQSLPKTHLLVSKLITLGYQQTEDGHGPAPEKISAITELTPPTNVLELWQFWD